MGRGKCDKGVVGPILNFEFHSEKIRQTTNNCVWPSQAYLPAGTTRYKKYAVVCRRIESLSFHHQSLSILLQTQNIILISKAFHT